MAYNPQKKVQSILRREKKKARYKTHKSFVFKKIYLEAQAIKMSKNPTAPEIAFEDMLKELNIEYKSQKTVGFYIFDFYIPSVNTLCEVDGDYFHSNPEKYEVKDLNEMQRKNRIRDDKKERYALGTGYKIERFWETDIHKNPEVIKERLKKITTN